MFPVFPGPCLWHLNVFDGLYIKLAHIKLLCRLPSSVDSCPTLPCHPGRPGFMGFDSLLVAKALFLCEPQQFSLVSFTDA